MVNSYSCFCWNMQCYKQTNNSNDKLMCEVHLEKKVLVRYNGMIAHNFANMPHSCAYHTIVIFRCINLAQTSCQSDWWFFFYFSLCMKLIYWVILFLTEACFSHVCFWRLMVQYRTWCSSAVSMQKLCCLYRVGTLLPLGRHTPGLLTGW